MNAHRIVVCLLIAAVLLVGLAPMAGAQEPATDDLDAIAAALNAEAMPSPTLFGLPLPATLYAQMYSLPAGATWGAVSAAYATAMTAAGWTDASDPAQAGPAGINGMSWTKGQTGFAILFMASPVGNQTILLTLMASAPADQGAPGGQEGMARREIADCPCCAKVAAGTGGIWFQNYRTDAAKFEIKGPEKREFNVPAWTDDGPGCHYLAVKPGTYRVEAKTASGGKMEEDLDVVDGQVSVTAMPAEGA